MKLPPRASPPISRRWLARARPGWSKRNHAPNSFYPTTEGLMAKAKTAAAPKKVKKAAKPVKAVAKAAPKPAKKVGKKKADGKGAEMLWKLAEHPLVGELLAIGATAAVAAVAE